jgi:hypothetical protein
VSGSRTKRVPVQLSIKHAEYLIELIEDDLELDDEQHTLTENERISAEAVLSRLKDVRPEVERWYRYQKKAGLE